MATQPGSEDLASSSKLARLARRLPLNNLFTSAIDKFLYEQRSCLTCDMDLKNTPIR